MSRRPGLTGAEPILHWRLLPTPCSKAGFCLLCKTNTTAVLHLRVLQNNAETFVWCCSSCNRFNPFGQRDHFISKEKVQAFLTPEQIAALPVLMPDASNRCARCGDRECELHHWAPKGIFGNDEAEKWPKDYLCKVCHACWHQLVTPQLVKK